MKFRTSMFSVVLVAVASLISLRVLLLSATCFASPAPQIDRVEPPNWWIEQSINPVRLLLHGSGLENAVVTTDSPELSIGSMKSTAGGSYLFFDLKIDKGVTLGVHNLTLTTHFGSTVTQFEIDRPLPQSGRFSGFGPDDVIYLIMPDRFADGDVSNDDPAISKGLYDRTNPRLYHGGDFQGIIGHLAYLKELGVTAIWINPIYDNYNGKYPGGTSADFHGYGSVNDYGVEEHFGTMQKLRELVDRAHAMHIKVIQDQVANHVGQMHPWVNDPPTPTWFNGTASDHDNNTYQVWTAMDPHANSEELKSTLGGWFANILPDLNQGDPEVARYEIQNTLWWIGETGIDGVREDTMPYVPRTFWNSWNTAISQQYPHVNVVGEVFDGDPALVSFFQGGAIRNGVDTKMYSLFDYPSYFPLRRVFAHGDSFHDLVDDEAHDWLFPNADHLVTFLGNHDVSRFMSDDGATAAGLKLAYTFLMTSRGVPVIYYGDEIGMSGGNDPDNRRDFPGGFPGDPVDAFTKAGRTPEQESIWEHVSQLTHLRAELAPLRRGKQTNLLYSDQVWAYARTYNGSVVVIVLNNGLTKATVVLPVHEVGLKNGAALVDRLGVAGQPVVTDGNATVAVPARSGAILTVQ